MSVQNSCLRRLPPTAGHFLLVEAQTNARQAKRIASLLCGIDLESFPEYSRCAFICGSYRGEVFIVKKTVAQSASAVTFVTSEPAGSEDC
jgi:hypothetical protein